jgi:nitrate/TMAO reductase-like tetraheme cytochrome c subunit
MKKLPPSSLILHPSIMRLHLLALAAAVGLIALLAGDAYARHLEQDDRFCASCHTQPETEYLARFEGAVAQNNAQDLAAFHHRKKDTRCIDCHAGEGIIGRGQVLTLAAWDALKYNTGTARQPAVVVVPVQNEACIKCHADALTKAGFDNHEHNKMSDPSAPFIACTDCHVTHRLGDERNAFQFRDAILPKCEYCHVQMVRGPRGLVK